MPSLGVSGDNKFGSAWSETKLSRVARYIDAYLKVFKNKRDWPRQIIYIDAFCGSGYQQLNDNTKKNKTMSLFDDSPQSKALVIPGSAMRAIAASKNCEDNGGRGFDRFIFLDKSQPAIDRLGTRITNEYPDVIERCKFSCSDVNIELPEIIRQFDWKTTRGVVFLDPYAMQLNWSTLAALKTANIDGWLLFPTSAAMRTLRISGPDTASENKLDTFFGTHNWLSELYSENINQDLFGGEVSVQEREKGTLALRDFFKLRLSEQFDAHVSNPLTLKNSKNSDLFDLYFVLTNGSDSAWRIASNIANNLLVD